MCVSLLQVDIKHLEMSAGKTPDELNFYIAVLKCCVLEQRLVLLQGSDVF